MNVSCVPAETEATTAYTRENFTLQLEEIKLMSECCPTSGLSATSVVLCGDHPESAPHPRMVGLMISPCRELRMGRSQHLHNYLPQNLGRTLEGTFSTSGFRQDQNPK